MVGFERNACKNPFTRDGHIDSEKEWLFDQIFSWQYRVQNKTVLNGLGSASALPLLSRLESPAVFVSPVH